MLLTSIILYLIGTLAIGYWSSKLVKNTNDYILAGKKMPLMIASCALFATWFGSETVLGAPSEFIDKGFLGVIEDPFGASLCLLLMGLFFAKKLYRMDILTFGDFYRIKYGSKVELISSIFMIISFFGWVAAQLVALGIVLNVVTGMGVTSGILIGAVIVVFYTYVGGMWAVSITDFIQTIVIILGMLFLLFELLAQTDGIQSVIDKTPEGYFSMVPEFSVSGIGMYVGALITLGLGSIPSQDIFQRLMSSKSEKVAVRSAYLGAFMYLSIAMIPLFIGLIASQLYPEFKDGDTQEVLPAVVMSHASMLTQILFFGALLSAIMSSTSSGILAPAAILGENILKPHIRKLDDKQLLRIMKLSVVIIAAISTALANMKSNIYELVGESSAVSLVSLFVPMMFGLYAKKTSTLGAMLSMLLGFGVWLVLEFFEPEIPSIIWGTLASFAGMIIGRMLDKNPRINNEETNTSSSNA